MEHGEGGRAMLREGNVQGPGESRQLLESGQLLDTGGTSLDIPQWAQFFGPWCFLLYWTLKLILLELLKSWSFNLLECCRTFGVLNFGVLDIQTFGQSLLNLPFTQSKISGPKPVSDVGEGGKTERGKTTNLSSRLIGMQ